MYRTRLLAHAEPKLDCKRDDGDPKRKHPARDRPGKHFKQTAHN